MKMPQRKLYTPNIMHNHPNNEFVKVKIEITDNKCGELKELKN